MLVILVSAGIGIVAVLLLSLKMQNDINARGGCPDCSTPVPLVRLPTSWRQAAWCGWTCSAPGFEMDRQGRELAQK